MGRRVSFVPDSPEYQWDAVVRTFIEFKEAVHCAPSTLSGYRHTLRLFHQRTNPDLNDPNGLRRAVVKFLKDYENPYSYNLHRAYLRAFFNWCIEEEIIEGKNPVKGTPYRKTSPRIRHLDEDILRKLLKRPDKRTFDGFRDYAIMLVILDCGIRPGELLQIPPRDFNLIRGTIYVSDKIAKARVERILNISSPTVNAVNRVISSRHPLWGQEVPVFCSRDGKKMHGSSWNHEFKKYIRKAKLDDIITPYDLRHTFAIMFLRNGGNLFALKTIMGHQELKMTERYARFVGRDVTVEHEKASPVKHLMSKRVSTMKKRKE
jgi:site-specific recombinase XerD